MVPLFISNSFNCILIIVDWLMKIIYYISIIIDTTTLDIAKLFINNIYKLYRILKTIITNRDIYFISKFWKVLFELLRTKLIFLTEFHLQTDGQTKKTNQTLE